MRKKISKFKLSINAIFIFTLLLVLSSTFSSVSSDSEQLYIDCLDEIEEGEEFSIIVYSYNASYEMSTQNNVNITFDGSTYLLNEEILSLYAPDVEENTDFSINATKTGFMSDMKTITVLDSENIANDNLKLEIVPNSFLINPDEPFYVTVYYDNTRVEGATVFIQSSGNTVTTNSQGNAILNAPKDGETIIVKAKKDGYETGSVELTLKPAKPFWEGLIEHKFFPLFAAFIVLLIAVVFVHLRQRKSIYARAKQISDNKVVEKYTSSDENISNAKKYGYDSKDSSDQFVHVRPSSDSKVEEIRITRPQKQREVVPVKTNEETKAKNTNKSSAKKDDYESWFKGTDEIKYEIDKLTGEVDEEGMDKWFEGVGSLKDKVNEKMKKKKKERDDEEY